MQPVEESEIPRLHQCFGEALGGLAPLLRKALSKFAAPGVVIVIASAGGSKVQPVHQHVSVSHSPQRRPRPTEIGAYVADPRRVQYLRKRLEVGSKAARGHPGLVDVFGLRPGVM